MPLYQIGPNTWSNRNPDAQVARSSLPLPYVISDTMPPTEQVDGKFYTSKAEFRRVGRANGLIEVGTEKLKPKQRSTNDRAAKDARKRSIKTAIEKYKAGHRFGRPL